MLARIKEFLRSAEPQRDAPTISEAAAALMVEAAGLDGGIDDGERSAIGGLLQQHYHLTAGEADALLARTERRMRDTQQLHPFIRTVNEACSEAEKTALVELLWEVVYADGRAHAFETNLMRRLGGLLHVTDLDIGAARRRVLARAGGPAERSE